jgi:hypothetical protein
LVTHVYAHGRCEAGGSAAHTPTSRRKPDPPARPGPSPGGCPEDDDLDDDLDFIPDTGAKQAGARFAAGLGADVRASIRQPRFGARNPCIPAAPACCTDWQFSSNSALLVL